MLCTQIFGPHTAPTLQHLCPRTWPEIAPYPEAREREASKAFVAAVATLLMHLNFLQPTAADTDTNYFQFVICGRVRLVPQARQTKRELEGEKEWKRIQAEDAILGPRKYSRRV